MLKTLQVSLRKPTFRRVEELKYWAGGSQAHDLLSMGLNRREPEAVAKLFALDMYFWRKTSLSTNLHFILLMEKQKWEITVKLMNSYLQF